MYLTRLSCLVVYVKFQFSYCTSKLIALINKKRLRLPWERRLIFESELRPFVRGQLIENCVYIAPIYRHLANCRSSNLNSCENQSPSPLSLVLILTTMCSYNRNKISLMWNIPFEYAQIRHLWYVSYVGWVVQWWKWSPARSRPGVEIPNTDLSRLIWYICRRGSNGRGSPVVNWHDLTSFRRISRVVSLTPLTRYINRWPWRILPLKMIYRRQFISKKNAYCQPSTYFISWLQLYILGVRVAFVRLPLSVIPL